MAPNNLVKLFPSIAEAKIAVPLNSIKLLIIDGKKIALAHVASGLYAFDNACPHQHEPMHKGLLTKYEEAVCPLHYYRFNLKSGQEAFNRCKSISTYPISSSEEGVFIRLE